MVTCKQQSFHFLRNVYILLPLAQLSLCSRSSGNIWFSDEMVFQFELEDKVESSACVHSWFVNRRRHIIDEQKEKHQT